MSGYQLKIIKYLSIILFGVFFFNLLINKLHSIKIIEFQGVSVVLEFLILLAASLFFIIYSQNLRIPQGDNNG